MDIDIFTFSDESGVFDVKHNEYYVFGGLIITGKEEKDSLIRKYRNAEKQIAPNYPRNIELKASTITPKDRAKLFRSLNKSNKFAVIVKQNCIKSEIFDNKKSKQRYLDYAYKIGVKNALVKMMNNNVFRADDIRNVFFYVDEHTTATDGRYELREGLLQELKEGTFNYNFNKFFPPILPAMVGITLNYCNSAKNTLVRAADIVANKVYHEVCVGRDPQIRENLYIKYLP